MGKNPKMATHSAFKLLAWHKRTVEQNVKKDIEIQISTITEKLGDLENKLLSAIYNTNRAMSFIAEKEGSLTQSVIWDMAATVSGYDYDSEDTEALIFWLESALESINQVKPVGETIKLNINIFGETFKKLSESRDKEVKKLINEVKPKAYHIIYTIPNPPDNLFEGESASPPPILDTSDSPIVN